MLPLTSSSYPWRRASTCEAATPCDVQRRIESASWHLAVGSRSSSHPWQKASTCEAATRCDMQRRIAFMAGLVHLTARERRPKRRAIMSCLICSLLTARSAGHRQAVHLSACKRCPRRRAITSCTFERSCLTAPLCCRQAVHLSAREPRPQRRAKRFLREVERAPRDLKRGCSEVEPSPRRLERGSGEVPQRLPMRSVTSRRHARSCHAVRHATAH